jgi:hypothetical protein
VIVVVAVLVVAAFRLTTPTHCMNRMEHPKISHSVSQHQIAQLSMGSVVRCCVAVQCQQTLVGVAHVPVVSVDLHNLLQVLSIPTSHHQQDVQLTPVVCESAYVWVVPNQQRLNQV